MIKIPQTTIIPEIYIGKKRDTKEQKPPELTRYQITPPVIPPVPDRKKQFLDGIAKVDTHKWFITNRFPNGYSRFGKWAYTWDEFTAQVILRTKVLEVFKGFYFKDPTILTDLGKWTANEKGFVRTFDELIEGNKSISSVLAEYEKYDKGFTVIVLEFIKEANHGDWDKLGLNGKNIDVWFAVECKSACADIKQYLDEKVTSGTKVELLSEASQYFLTFVTARINSAISMRMRLPVFFGSDLIMEGGWKEIKDITDKLSSELKGIEGVAKIKFNDVVLNNFLTLGDRITIKGT